MYGIFEDVVNRIHRFQRTGREGKSLLADLLEWIASEIARPYRSALHEQEICQPKLIYGVERRTDEVPLE